MAQIWAGMKSWFHGEKENQEEEDSKKEGGKPTDNRKRTPKIVKEDIMLPPCSRGKLAFGLHNVYTEEECEEFIRQTEERGYEQALLNIGGGMQTLATDVRKSERCIWDSPEHAKEMFRRIRPYLPETFQGCRLVGLNDRLRFLRYDPGDYFKPHMDGTYYAPNNDRSRITVHLYLNEGYKGGSTTFMQGFPLREHESHPEDVAFQSRPGSIVVFQHDILHEGSLLREGRKYTMRTDIMYRQK